MTKCLHVPKIDHCGECVYRQFNDNEDEWVCNHPDVLDGPHWLDPKVSVERIPGDCPLDDAEEVGDE